VVDLDLLFARDPFLLLEERYFSSLDLFLQSGAPSKEIAQTDGHVNTGFYCLAPTDAAKQFVNIWLEDLSHWDQKIAGQLLKDNAVPNLKWAALPNWVAFNSCHLGALAHGNNVDDTADSYASTFEQFLLHHGDLLRSTTVIHFPCMWSQALKTPLAALALQHLVQAKQLQV
jgi:hypothetical protein